MEHSKLEVQVVEKTVSMAVESDVRELVDLQLALVGGGMGDTIL